MSEGNPEKPQHDLKAFVALLDQCRAQVEEDPSGYLGNPHLYGLLHRIYLRLCHGMEED